jgi:hypothetical protein
MSDFRVVAGGGAGTGPDRTVRVSSPERAWVVAPGQVLTFGRSRSTDIRLPDDDHISRRAGCLQVLEDCVLIRNDSRTKVILLRPSSGEDRVIEPGAATASLPYRTFCLALTGKGDLEVVLEVDARGLDAAAEHPDLPPTSSTDTVTAPVSITAAQRRVLVALCEPMLTAHGAQAVPATYAQVGTRLGRSPGYVRNVVKGLRETLAGYGVPGLTTVVAASERTAGERPGPAEDFRPILARWAVRNRWVSVSDVSLLLDGETGHEC